MSSRPVHPNGAKSLRVLVLSCPAQADPQSLLVAMSNRGATVSVVAEPPSVMVELALNPIDILVIAEPDLQPLICPLLAAVRHYYPKTRCCQYRQSGTDGHPQLEDLDSEARKDEAGHPPDLAPMPPEPVAEDTNKASKAAGPNLDANFCLASNVPPPATEAVAEPLISDEELDMLLGPCPSAPSAAED